ncbi:relaxase/mobilization nuclease domain-containing protein (plasmid) [Moraxella canis]|uniref:Relaxase/mobilization nuclease domain-containing protein n=1 Tax=Moraxella canis TaxID=90239 RepID=A0ABZ0X0J5_9GAMM|nr:relaxase/mobilization nuclease domain-containing protein [Moraxella canis]WQE05019.1 relaxase/mobilization nuclease domain-containing protein [Moraxella canis]
MITKFFSKPNRSKASPKNTIKYLTGSLDGIVTRAGAKLLKGDILLSLAFAESVNRKNQFTVGCLSFKEEQIDEHKKHEIMADFERTALAGLGEDDYNILWIEHTDKNRLEMNFFIPRMELTTGNDLQPFFAGADLGKMDLWKDCINIEYQLHAPQDEPRFTAYKPDWYKTSTNKYVQNAAAIKDYSDEYFAEKIRLGEINSRADIIQFLADSELSPKPSKNYITITPPPPMNDDGSIAIDPKTNLPYEPRNVRLKGSIYGESADQFIQESRAKTSGKYHERNADNISDFRRELESIIRRDAERNIKRYEAGRRRSEREATRADQQLTARADPALSADISRYAEQSPSPAERPAEPAGTAERRDQHDQPAHSHAERISPSGDLHPIRPSGHQPKSAENSGANPPISPAHQQGEKGHYNDGWHSWLDGVSDRIDDLASGATIRPAGDSESGAGTLWRSIADDRNDERAIKTDRIAEKRDPSINPEDPASPPNSRTDQSTAGTPAPARAGAFTPSGRATESPAGSTGGASTQTSGSAGGATTQGGSGESQSGERPPASVREEPNEQIFMQLKAENEQTDISIFDKIRDRFSAGISRAIASFRELASRSRKLVESVRRNSGTQQDWQAVLDRTNGATRAAEQRHQDIQRATAERKEYIAEADRTEQTIDRTAGTVSECNSDAERTNQIIDKYTRIAEQRTSARLAETTSPDGATLANQNRQEASRDRRLAGTSGDSDEMAEYLLGRDQERADAQKAMLGADRGIASTKQHIDDTSEDIKKYDRDTKRTNEQINWIDHKIQSHVQHLEQQREAEAQRQAQLHAAAIAAREAKEREERDRQRTAQRDDYDSPSPF